MDCLNNIIGIIESTGIVTPPIDYDKSSSGLYLLGGSENSIVKEGCETEYLLKQCDKAIKSAITQTAELYLSCVAEDFKEYVPIINTWVGNKNRATGITELNNIMGIKISPRNVKNTSLHIDKLGLWVSMAGNYTVKVWKNTTKIEEFPITVTTANSESIIDVDVTLDLYSDFEDTTYYISYELLGASPVYNSILNCSSCNNTAIKLRENMDKYSFFNGFSANSEGEIEDANLTNATAYGVLIHAQLKCDSENVICDNYSKSQSFKKVLETAIYHKSIANLVRIIIDSKKIDQFTLLSHDSLLGKINHHRKEWKDRVLGWLCSNTNIEGSGCYTCDDSRMEIIKG